eukprot:gene19725-14325_t
MQLAAMTTASPKLIVTSLENYQRFVFSVSSEEDL